MNIKREYVLVASGVAIMALGFAEGYFTADRRLRKRYAEMTEYEIKQAKAFYSRLHKTGEYATPESTADKLMVDATEALRTYLGEEEVLSNLPESDPKEEESVTEEANEPDEIPRHERPVKQNVFTQPVDRDFSLPYSITMEEYMENPNDHDQITLTYYTGDEVLADERDKPMDDVDGIVGRYNLEFFGRDSGDDNVVLVRNDKIELDFEITKSDGTFAHQVLGFDEEELKHSDTMRRRGRRRWDDDE
jgi:hypothetical protein